MIFRKLTNKFAFLIIFALLPLQFIVAQIGSHNALYIVQPEMTKWIYYGNVWWFEFQVINDGNSTLLNQRIEVTYPKTARLLRDKKWKGKAGIYPREYATKDNVNRKVYFDFPEIAPSEQIDVWIAFVATRTANHHFIAEIIDTTTYVEIIDTVDIAGIDSNLTATSTESDTISDISSTDSTTVTDSATQTEELSGEKLFSVSFASLFVVLLLLAIFLCNIVLMILAIVILKKIYRSFRQFESIIQKDPNKVGEQAQPTFESSRETPVQNIDEQVNDENFETVPNITENEREDKLINESNKDTEESIISLDEPVSPVDIIQDSDKIHNTDDSEEKEQSPFVEFDDKELEKEGDSQPDSQESDIDSNGEIEAETSHPQSRQSDLPDDDKLKSKDSELGEIYKKLIDLDDDL